MLLAMSAVSQGSAASNLLFAALKFLIPGLTGSLPLNIYDGLSRSHVFEPIVSADGDSVFARCQSLHRELIGFRSAVTDAMRRCQQNPFAAIHAVLRLFDTAGRICHREADVVIHPGG